MKRLVYSPSVQAYIKTDDGVMDVSPYIVSGNVNRKVNQISTAQLVLRNPVIAGSNDLLFTENRGRSGHDERHPLFHPMDPIIILMTRIQGHPVQVFTGYLDSSPYLQLFPGLCQIQASCTLKRLKYTQWDAALPWVTYFLGQFGWAPNGDSGITNFGAAGTKLQATAGHLLSSSQFNDGSIGALLYAVLTYIGQWDASTVLIEKLPKEIKDLVINLYHSIQGEVESGQKLFEDLIGQILGANSHGGGSASSTSSSGGLSGTRWKVVASEEDDFGVTGFCGTSIQNDGYSELSTNVIQGNFDGHALGNLPCGTELRISANGKTVTTKLQDKGSGSTFNGPESGWPVMGLYQSTRAKLGFAHGGNPFHVEIQRVDGKPLSPVRGTLIKDSSNSSSAALQNHAGDTNITTNLSTAPNAGAMTSGFTTNATMAGSSPGGKTGNVSTGSGTGPGALLATIFPHGTKGNLERTDEGVDFGMPDGVPIGSPGDGVMGATISNFYNGQPLITVNLDQPISGYRYFYVSEGISVVKHSGRVQAGETIARTQSHGSGIEMGFGSATGDPAAHGHYNEGDVTKEGRDFAAAIGVPVVAGSQPFTVTGQALPGAATPGGGGGGGSNNTAGNNTAAAFAAMLNLPSIFSQAEALALTGKRSFIADQPLFPFVEQLCQASLRNFMSMPNGNFFAFFPDYFGLFGRKYYWEIRDIEIMDGRIDLSDDPLVTHAGVAGDVTQFSGEVTIPDIISTAGVFTILDALMTGYVSTNGKVPNLVNPDAKKNKAANKAADKDATQASINFLKTYGARPYVQQAPMIRSPFFELFLAFQNFMVLWSKQFQTTFELTFMPELFPGGLVGLPDHHIQLYVEEVVHDFDYTNGFTTTVNFSSPSQLDSSSRSNLSEGVARRVALDGLNAVGKAVAGVVNAPASTSSKPQHQSSH